MENIKSFKTFIYISFIDSFINALLQSCTGKRSVMLREDINYNLYKITNESNQVYIEIDFPKKKIKLFGSAGVKDLWCDLNVEAITKHDKPVGLFYYIRKHIGLDTRVGITIDFNISKFPNITSVDTLPTLEVTMQEVV